MKLPGLRRIETIRVPRAPADSRAVYVRLAFEARVVGPQGSAQTVRSTVWSTVSKAGGSSAGTLAAKSAVEGMFEHIADAL